MTANVLVLRGDNKKMDKIIEFKMICAHDGDKKHERYEFEQINKIVNDYLK